MNDNLKVGFRIRDWEVYPQENLLKTPDRVQVLEPRVMDVLVFLAGRCGEVVSRQELLDSVWAGVVVGDETLSRAVSVLRTELGDDKKNPRYMKTISKRGYCFIAKVIPLASEGLQKADSDSDASYSAPPKRYLRARKIGFAAVGLMAATIVYLVLAYPAPEKTTPKVSDHAIRDASLPERKIMLAVLPLDNFSNDPEQEYFSDGLTEELIAQLGNMQRNRLGVIARTSVMYYKGKSKQIDEIGRELGVDYVLEGSVRRAGNIVRITAQLIQVSDQTHLWAQSFERDVEDILALQSEVAQRITDTLALELLPGEYARLVRTRPVNSAAYEAFLKGRYHESRGGLREYSKAIEYYEEATQEDPAYALAYAALGHTYGMLAYLDLVDFSEGMQKFADYTRIAADLDHSLAEVQVNFADFKFYADWDWSAGEVGFRRAFELRPDSESVIWHYALCLHALGRFIQAIEVLENALELDPYSRQINDALTDTYLDSRQFERAVVQYRKMIDIDPQDAVIYDSLGDALEQQGKYDEAVEAYLKARNLAGESADRVRALRAAYRASGIHGYWRKRVEQLMAAPENKSPIKIVDIYARLSDTEQSQTWINEAQQRGQVSPLTLARIYTRLGDNDQALALLELAYAEHKSQLAWLKVDRRWDPLRFDPRFQELLRRMNFPD